MPNCMREVTTTDTDDVDEDDSPVKHHRPPSACFQVAVLAIGPSSHHCDEKVAHCHRIESDLVNASSVPKKVEPQKVPIF